MTQARVLAIGPTDRTSEERTPRLPLQSIPPSARRSFVPWLARVPGVQLGENDLTRVAPGRPRAQGELIEVSGRACDDVGRPLRHTLIEIWNANTHGRYAHKDDMHDYPLDPHFRGVGRTLTDEDGAYRFWTVKPGSYLARADIGRWRPSHVHFSVRGGAARLITQMYFAGDPYNAADPMRILMGDDFDRQIGREYAPQINDLARGFRFDIVVGGPNVSFFEKTDLAMTGMGRNSLGS